MKSRSYALSFSRWRNPLWRCVRGDPLSITWVQMIIIMMMSLYLSDSLMISFSNHPLKKLVLHSRPQIMKKRKKNRSRNKLLMSITSLTTIILMLRSTQSNSGMRLSLLSVRSVRRRNLRKERAMRVCRRLKN